MTTYTINFTICAYGDSLPPLDQSPKVLISGNISSSAGDGRVVGFTSDIYYGLLAQGFASQGVPGLKKAIASVFVINVIASNKGSNASFIPGFDAPLDVSDLYGPFTPPALNANGTLSGPVTFNGQTVLQIVGSPFTVTQ